MNDLEHYKRLERLFDSAPLNQGIFAGSELKVSDREAILKLTIGSQYFHAANAMHGAIYFKLLDDSAYFASASVEKTFFLLTKSYTIHFRRPVFEDRLKAIGKVVSVNQKEIISSSEIYNQEGKLVAHGEGVFVRGPKRLEELPV